MARWSSARCELRDNVAMTVVGAANFASAQKGLRAGQKRRVIPDVNAVSRRFIRSVVGSGEGQVACDHGCVVLLEISAKAGQALTLLKVWPAWNQLLARTRTAGGCAAVSCQYWARGRQPGSSGGVRELLHADDDPPQTGVQGCDDAGNACCAAKKAGLPRRA